MRFRVSVFFSFFFFCAQLLFCKVIPGEHSRLNYTTVYFQDDLRSHASAYTLVLYQDSGQRVPIAQITHSLPAFVVADLKWNTRYYWKVNATSGDKVLPGVLHRFGILKLAFDTNEVRLKVRLNKADHNNGELINIDYTRNLYNRQGQAIWTIPDTEESLKKGNQVRDMRFTKDNTVTFLNGPIPYEIDLNGNLVWSAPSPFIFEGDTVAYHHDFKKTSRGTYMVLANRKVFRKVLGNYTEDNFKGSQLKITNDTLYCKVLVAMVLEFDKHGKLLWFWDSNKYLKDVDLNYKKNPAGAPDFGVHSNAFSENEQGTKVYVGFRDLSRIVKMDKETKRVELSYGEKYPSGEAMIGDHLFRRQHDANVTPHNSILLLNNNPRGTEQPWVSTVMELKDNPAAKDSLVLWKFDLNFDTLTNGKSHNTGNVLELPNTNILVCTGFLGRIFEVTRQKKELVWDAFVEAKAPAETKWLSMPQYRCNWTKALTYYHFLAGVTVSKRSAAKRVVKMTIYNTGNADDFYNVTLMTKEGKIIASKLTKRIKMNKSADEQFTVEADTYAGQNLIALVVSQNSRGIYEELTVEMIN